MIQEVAAKKFILTISLVNQCQDPTFTSETFIAVAIESIVGFSVIEASPFASTFGTLVRRIPSTFVDHKGHTLEDFSTLRISFDSYCDCIDLASNHLQRT